MEPFNPSQMIHPDLWKIHARYCDKLRVRLSLSRRRIEAGDRIQNVYDDLYFQLASDLSGAFVAHRPRDAPQFQLQIEPFIKVEDEEIEIPVNKANYPAPQPKKQPTLNESMEKKHLQMSKAGPSRASDFSSPNINGRGHTTLPKKPKRALENSQAVDGKGPLQTSVMPKQILTARASAPNTGKSRMERKAPTNIPCPMPGCSYMSTTKCAISRHINKLHPELKKPNK